MLTGQIPTRLMIAVAVRSVHATHEPGPAAWAPSRLRYASTRRPWSCFERSLWWGWRVAYASGSHDLKQGMPGEQKRSTAYRPEARGLDCRRVGHCSRCVTCETGFRLPGQVCAIRLRPISSAPAVQIEQVPGLPAHPAPWSGRSRGKESAWPPRGPLRERSLHRAW